jgi:hypothetical protein
VLLAIATAGVILLTAAAYWRGHEDDPGLTTEIALILTAVDTENLIRGDGPVGL